MLTWIVISLFVYFNLFYLVAIFKKDFGIIDTAWGPSFLLIFLVGYYHSPFYLPSSFNSRSMLIGILIAIWAFRLAGYILYRNLKLKEEDYRYAKWRADWGKKANLTLAGRILPL